MTAPWTHHQRDVNGFTMHYVTAGSGYPLVLLHGWPQSWYEWRKVIPALSEKYTVIVPDLRGAGDSGRPLDGYDKRTLAADVRELVSQLGYEKVGVIGHDWGGSVSFFFAYDNRDLVERLFVLDMIPRADPRGRLLPDRLRPEDRPRLLPRRRLRLRRPPGRQRRRRLPPTLPDRGELQLQPGGLQRGGHRRVRAGLLHAGCAARHLPLVCRGAAD